jgi:hypothetical protein
MSGKTANNMPGTVNEAIKILAYNDWAWAINKQPDNNIDPHPKDKPTVVSLAESQYPWTEKQGRLAVAILKRYLTKFDTIDMDLRPLVENPVFDAPFRVISSVKTIEVTQDKDGTDIIEMRFPYDKKIVDLIRCCKDWRGLPSGYFLFDGEAKLWAVVKSDVTTYYMTQIAVRYNFTFVSESLLDEYEEIKKEKNNFKRPCATLNANKISLKNINESLDKYWQEHISNKKLLIQLDHLKNFNIKQNGLQVSANTKVGDRLAHSTHTRLWIDKDSYSKDDVIQGLLELESFPIIMPVSGDVVNDKNDLEDFHDWLNCFDKHGIDRHKNISWGFEFKDPKRWQDADDDEKYWMKLEGRTDELDEHVYDLAWDLCQLSKNFKQVDTNTKVYFVRNRIPRTLMRSNIQFGCGIMALGGGYYATGGENVKRLLDNLPKKLYYSNSQPVSYEWRDHAIIKL